MTGTPKRLFPDAMSKPVNSPSSRKAEACPSGPRVGSIVIYPAMGSSDSDARFLCALAGYSKSLFRHFSPSARLEHIVFTNLKGAAPRVFQDQGMTVSECWRKNHLLYWTDIFRNIRKYPSLRVVHLQHEFNQFGGVLTVPFIPVMLAVLRHVFRKRIAVTFHEVLSPEQLDKEFIKNTLIPFPRGVARVLFRWYYRLTSALADVVFVQDELFENTLKRYGVTTSIQIARIGADTAVVLPPKDAARSNLKIALNRKVLLFFGALDWRKGLDVLFDAFGRLPRGEYLLVIAGGQPPRIRDTPQYIAWHARLLEKAAGFGDEIMMLGFVDDRDISGLFAASDLVVLPYIVPQKVSAVLNLAASHETPCIASSFLSGQADARGLFEPGPDALKAKVEWSFNNLDLLRRMAIDFKRKYDWRVTAAVIEQAYQSLIN